MKSKGIVAYLCVAFLGAWSLWLAGWIVASRLFQISPSNPLFQFILLPGAFMPAIAAVVTRRWVTREGFSDVGLHLNFRRCWRYYLFGGYVLPIIVVGVIVALAILLGISQPDFSLHRSLAVLIPKAHSAFPRITPSLWAILIFQMMIVGVPLGTIVTPFGDVGYNVSNHRRYITTWTIRQFGSIRALRRKVPTKGVTMALKHISRLIAFSSLILFAGSAIARQISEEKTYSAHDLDELMAKVWQNCKSDHFVCLFVFQIVIAHNDPLCVMLQELKVGGSHVLD